MFIPFEDEAKLSEINLVTELGLAGSRSLSIIHQSKYQFYPYKTREPNSLREDNLLVFPVG